jgi:hypothetical protein
VLAQLGEKAAALQTLGSVKSTEEIS